MSKDQMNECLQVLRRVLMVIKTCRGQSPGGQHH